MRPISHENRKKYESHAPVGNVQGYIYRQNISHDRDVLIFKLRCFNNADKI